MAAASMLPLKRSLSNESQSAAVKACSRPTASGIHRQGTKMFAVHCASCQACAQLPPDAVKAHNDHVRVIGTACTAIEGALVYARHVGPERSKREAEGSDREVLSAQEVEQLTTEEGLTLVTSSRAATGFRGVEYRPDIAKPYRAIAPVDTSRILGPTLRATPRAAPGARPTTRSFLGNFATPYEAALAYARRLGPEASRAAELGNERLSAVEGAHGPSLTPCHRPSLAPCFQPFCTH